MAIRLSRLSQTATFFALLFMASPAFACFAPTTYSDGQDRTTVLVLNTGGCMDAGSGVTATQSGVVQNGTGLEGITVLNKEGAGTVILTATNTYTGGTNILGGNIQISSQGNLGSSSSTITLAGGSLQFGDHSTFANPITATSNFGGIDLNGKVVSYTGTTLSGTSRIFVFGGGTFTMQNITSNTNSGGFFVQDALVNMAATSSTLFGTGDVALNNSTSLGATLLIGGDQLFANDLYVGFNGVPGGTNTVEVTSNSAIGFDALNGNGTLNKTGNGTLIINGVGAPIGSSSVGVDVNVNDGTFQVGDADHATASHFGDVTVNSGGTLQGFGTVSGNVTVNSGGTVAPGGSIGTLNITGNYTQGAGSTLAIEVSPTANDVLNVTGTATLAGPLQITFANGTYTARRITFLNAGSVSGTFTSVTAINTPAGFEFTNGYDPVTGFLDLIAITVITPTNATIYTSMTTAQMDNTQHANDMILEHIEDASFDGPALFSGQGIAGKKTRATIAVSENKAGVNDLVASASERMESYGGWFKAAGRFSDVNAQGTAPGFDSQTGGFMAGFDRVMAKNISLGLAAGYDHTNLEEDTAALSEGTADTARIALYGAAKVDRFTLGGTLGYAHAWVDTTRFVAGAGSNATGAYSQHAITASLQASTTEKLGAYTIAPKAGMLFTQLFEDGFTETGAPGFNMTVKADQTTSLRPFVGVGVSRSITFDNGLTFTPELRARYTREMFRPARRTNVNVSGTDFTIDGVHPSSDTVTLGTGFTAKMDNKVDVFGNYDVNLRTGTTFDHVVSAGAKIKF